MWQILKKELLEITRDRKTLFFMIALPILIFPLLIGGVIYLGASAASDAKAKSLDFAVITNVANVELADKLAAVDNLNLIELTQTPSSDEEIAQLIKSGELDFVLKIPDNYGDDLLNSGQILITLYLNAAQLNFVQERLDEITKEISERNQKAAFEILGVSPEVQTGLLEPIKIERENVADQRETIGATIGGMIPYFLFILCLQGAMIPAGDIGAGEKERGTLETLLLSPISRTQIVLGKFLTLCVAGVTSALVTVLSIAIWSLVVSQGFQIEKVAEFMSSIDLIDFLLVFFMLVPIVAIFSASLLSLSIYARSYKEAQGYMSPLIFVVLVPVMIALMPGIELKGVYAWIPLTNVALAIKELVKGTMDYFQLLAIFGSSVLLAGALLYFCVYWFNREKVLFR
ncbi:ABC transporter permease [Glaciecola sp. 1036]|uniref:ABC transporter permease n=1 Tax=Alteromonadaceae TaxID=72275 RepID=UPI003D06E1FB